MARPSLDEIFGTPPAQQQGRPRLDQIFSQPASMPSMQPMQQPVQQPIQQQRPSLDQIFGVQPQPVQQQEPEDDGLSGYLAATGKALMQPAAAALEVISYFDKPRGAIAGTVKAAQEDRSLWEGAKQGWRENTSWKETFDPEWVRENPTIAAIAGFGADVVADPLIFLTPAKIAKGTAKASKAVGLTDALAPTAKRIAESKFGQKAGEAASKYLGIGRATDDAYRNYQATNAALQGATKEGVDQVEKIISDAFPNADRTNVEATVQRLVEAYPDIGQFARSADKVTARDTVLNVLFKDLETAQGGVKAAKEAVGMAGTLTDEERTIADILDTNRIATNQLNEAVTTARNMGEVIPQRGQVARGIDENIKIKRATYKLIQEGKFPEQDLPTLRGLFSDDELRAMMPTLKRGFRNNPALEEIEAGIRSPGTTAFTTPASQLEEKAIQSLPDITKNVDLTPELPAVNLSTNVTKSLPDLMRTGQQSTERVLPKVRIGERPQQAVNLSNITEDGRRLLSSVQNVPELAQKIRTDRELTRQMNAVEKARAAIERADVSPEKTTQVIDSALKQGYTPTQVEAMFNASEVMRGINQTMTSEAMKRALIPIEAAGEFSGGRHLRRMYAAFEDPDRHYQTLMNTFGKAHADKFMASYSKFQRDLAARGLTIDTATFEARKNLPKDLQNQLGRIYEASYPFAKGNKMAAEQFARYDYLKSVADKWGSDTMQAGYQRLPITADGKWGALGGKFLPKKAYDEVTTAMKNFDRESKVWEKNIQRWKALKLINPASISRNTMSGAAMANVFGEVPFQKLPGLIGDTLSDMRKGTDRYLEARNTGLFQTNIAKADLDAIMSKVRGEKPSTMDKIDSYLGKGMNIFSAPDNFWRMLVYNHHRDMGKTAQEAAAVATRALFDYGNAPEWLNSLSRSGLIPFAKFPFFATKETARALWERPAQVTKYTKAQSQVNTEDREQIMPNYLRAKTMLPIGEGTRTVNGKPQKIQNNIDLDYILPFSSDLTFGNPIIEAVQIARTGKNSIGMEIIKPGMTDAQKTAAMTKYLAGAFGPSAIAPYNLDRIINAVKGNVDEKGRQYNLPWALAQTFAGIRNVPINTEEVYRQKMSGIRRQQNEIQSVMRDVARDRSMPEEQKRERIQAHRRQLRNLSAEAQRTNQAYLREKARGAI